jgi:hypothetical protein
MRKERWELNHKQSMWQQGPSEVRCEGVREHMSEGCVTSTWSSRSYADPVAVWSTSNAYLVS